MTTESDNINQNTNINTNNQENENLSTLSLEEALEQINHLKRVNKEVIESRDKVKTKLRTFEELQAQQEQQALEEQGRFKELAEAEKKRADQYEQAFKQNAINSVIDRKLAEIGLPEDALGTAKALLDRSKVQFEDGSVNEQSVVEAIDQLKSQHQILFNVRTKTPDVKRSDETNSSSYLEELNRIRSNPRDPRAKQKLQELRAKYGKE